MKHSSPLTIPPRWAKEFNEKLQSLFHFEVDLPAVFIDTFYYKKDAKEVASFASNTKKLWELAQDKLETPFYCRDIEVVLHEATQMRGDLAALQEEAEVKDSQIADLSKEVQMLYGIKAHMDALVKENQVMSRSLMETRERERVESSATATACQLGEGEGAGLGHMVAFVGGLLVMLGVVLVIASTRRCQHSQHHARVVADEDSETEAI